MIQIEELEVGYGRSVVLQGLSMAAEEGRITSIIGANGAGKTTLLRAISGMVRPRRGSIAVRGARLERMSPREIVRLGICHVPEGRQVFPELTVAENLRLGAIAVGSKVDEARQQALVFTYFPRLAERRGQLAGTLSGGEQQMLAVGRALMAAPDVLLLDEPSTGLAPKLVQQVFRIIRELNRREKLTVLLVEQNPRLALQLADYSYVLVNGRIAASGSADTMESEAIVRSFYLGSAGHGGDAPACPAVVGLGKEQGD